MRFDALPFAIGTIGFGVVCLAFGDFGLQWQPVPEGVPGRTALAYLNGILLVASGTLLLWPRTALGSARFLAGYFLLWVLLLKVPKVAAAPAVVLPWLGFAEILSLALGAAMLALLLDTTLRPAALRPLRYLYGVCPLIFGISHFVYVDFTAAMVPAWIPGQLFWAWATGIGHVAAGAAIFSGIMARLAATMLAGMMASFVLLLHVPRVIADPTSQLEWTMLCVATALAGAAWIVRTAISHEEPPVAAPAVIPA